MKPEDDPELKRDVRLIRVVLLGVPVALLLGGLIYLLFR
jgi:hypothetical protein